MKAIGKVWLGLFAFMAFTMVACGLVGAPQPGPSPDALFTQGAQTVQAQLTQQAIDTLVAQLTQAAGGLTVTPGAPSVTPLAVTPGSGTPTAIVAATSTQIPALPTNTSAPIWVPPTATRYVPPPTQRPNPCHLADFVKDVAIPDGTSLRPAEDFTKVWRLRNVGSCTWNSDYEVVFSSGDRMGGPKAQRIGQTVRPGETVDIKVDMTAPITNGKFRGYWMLRATNGATFGIGAQGASAFWVQIRVEGRASSPYAYDFAAWVCTADWRTSAGVLACPSDPDDNKGSVVLLEEPELENGRLENELAIWTRPHAVNSGWITGVYPAYTVQPGDHFIADIGCLADSSGCDVTFGLSYIEGNQTTHLRNWRETYDGALTRIDIDLTPLVGKTVKFSLGVSANDRPGRANAVWLAPSIRAGKPTPIPPPPTPTPTVTPTQVVLAWKETGGIANLCSLLEITSNGLEAEAVAYDCRNNQPIVIDRRPLKAQELANLNVWLASYKPIEAQTADPFPDGMQTLFVLAGKGGVTAPATDIEGMRTWAAAVYHVLTEP
ncbi:MAG TPA: NBR1-Ig-like domain-containing protein [Anaerolineales bacterium]|nr:NBR1-Ig-like domain-containing protein [Anaerolineales bacterium]